MRRLGKHGLYLRYVARHKLHVLRATVTRAGEVLRYGDWLLAGHLVYRGLVHDWHKFLPSEWFAYADYFYGGDVPAEKVDPWFRQLVLDRAWLRHLHRADHHWQWWLLREDDGGTKTLPMSEIAREEMLCDWLAMSNTMGDGGWVGVLGWYRISQHTQLLHEHTRQWVDEQLDQRSKEG